MSAVLYAMLGVFLYATQNILIEAKLKGFSTTAVVLLFSCANAPIALLALARMKIAGEPIVWPSGPGLWFTLAAGAVFFFADYFYVKAYNDAGGNIFAITVCAALMPVFVTLLSFALTGKLPNAYQVGGMVAAAMAVALVAKGGMVAE